MDTPHEIRLHIGAHKTATTHLQQVLDAHKRTTLRNGCVYLSRGFVRREGLLRAVHANHWKPPAAFGRARCLSQFLSMPDEYPKRILISEEDILGLSTDLLDLIYRKVRRHLLPWSTLAEGGGMHIHLAIRDHAGILPSAYSQALKDGPVPFLFEDYKQGWLAARPSWATLVETIITLFGSSRVTVWTMEYHLANPAEIFRVLSGTELTDIPMQAPRGTRRLSAVTVRRMEQLDPSLGGSAGWRAVQELMRDNDPADAFDPLSMDEKAVLSALYRSDIERIRGMGVRFLG